MAKLTRRGAANVTTDLDKIATLFQNRAAAVGVPEKIAHDFAYRCDLLADHIEKFAAQQAAAEGDEDEESHAGKKAAIDETGTSVEPAPGNQGFDANEIGDLKAGPLDIITPPDEPWMAGEFTQERFVSLREKQQSGELAANAAAGKADTKLASSLDASIAKLAKLAKLAAVGSLSDAQAEAAVKTLLDLENKLAEAQAELEALAGAVLKRQKALTAEHKKVLTTLKDNLPATAAKQGAAILRARTAIIKYTKAPEGKPPGFQQMKSTDVDDVDTKGGDIYGRIEREISAEIAKQVQVIADTVYEELTHIATPVRTLKYELENTPKTASAKSAGVLDIIVKARDWLFRNINKIVSLFDVGTSAIDGAVDSLTKSLNDAQTALSKTAAKYAEEEEEEVEEVVEEAPKKGGKKAGLAYDLFSR